MSWNDVRMQQIPRLEAACAVLEQCARLAAMAPADMAPDTTSALRTVVAKARVQLDRLRANRFEIAILGLEKAGKSTLLNAWLGTEILPAAPERCTYTKTELWAAQSEGEQSLTIEYHAPSEFEESVRAQREELARLPEGNDRKRLAEELREIELHRDAIAGWVGRGADSLPFKELDEVRETLVQAVMKDKARARAAKRIVLRTIALRSDRDVVFFDVPGFNSPVTLHKKQAEEAIRAVDVMLYAKELSKPDTEGSEVAMLALADHEDQLVRVADKTFVALTRIDAAATREQLDELVEKSHRSWPGLPADRIVPVCPPVRLANLGTGLQPTNVVGAKLRERLADLGVDDGLEKLKEAVGRYVDNERARVLERRCATLLDETRRLADEVERSFEGKIPTDLAVLEDTVEAEGDRAFSRWWAVEWRRVREEFAKFYSREILGKEDVDGPAKMHPRLTALRGEFTQKVDELCTAVALLDEDRLRAVYGSEVRGPGGVHQPEHAHRAVRRKLHPEVMKAIEGVSVGLASALQDILRLVCSEAQSLLWGVDAVARELDPNEGATRARVEHGISTLFLRFARVAVNLLVSAPRSERAKLIRREQADLFMLAMFDKRLGSDWMDHVDRALDLALFAAEKMGILPPGAGALVKESGKALAPAKRRTPFDDDFGLTAGSADDVGSVVAEIMGDIEALQALLKTAVFDAAGFVAYCNQEVEFMREHFLRLESEEHRWQSVIRTEVRRKNPSVPFRLEDRQEELRRKRELAVVLAAVRGARANFVRA